MEFEFPFPGSLISTFLCDAPSSVWWQRSEQPAFSTSGGFFVFPCTAPQLAALFLRETCSCMKIVRTGTASTSRVSGPGVELCGDADHAGHDVLFYVM